MIRRAPRLLAAALAAVCLTQLPAAPHRLRRRHLPETNARFPAPSKGRGEPRGGPWTTRTWRGDPRPGKGAAAPID
ncbi:hypothetical protein [Streptomyces chromofuscus]|uniref:Secreted protein n=1 Tax=Streptomyces chromofuscus TaxID=42881 RepID=A0A7M2TEH9_STRCW|nr:hypothetical protein [Streptomyces chromofuscus]QOV46559.1 hypothetical protein IPT68_12030 [Streptomyces chromofuscus]GGT07744.1 hypothetical protein GCM10010254_30160 [Streptomyces chromofuscus]